jgi:DnaK suppressor protein
MSDATPDPEFFRQRLLELRAELSALTAIGDEAAQTVELDQTKVGRLSRMDALQAQAMSKATNQRRAETLRGIEAALKRIDRGGYG